MLHLFPTLGLYKTKEIWDKFMSFAEDWAIQPVAFYIYSSLCYPPLPINYLHRQSRLALYNKILGTCRKFKIFW